MQPTESPIKRRLRTVRRRVTAGVVATFAAAWLAVAAVGKGGSTPATSGTATGTQRDGGAASGSTQSRGGGASDTNSTQSDGGGASDTNSTQSDSSSDKADPVTTAQS